MKAKLVQMVDGQFAVTEVDMNNAIDAFGVRGYAHTGFNFNAHHRAELQGAPTFKNLCGPMYDGPGCVRYEEWAAYERLSA